MPFLADGTPVDIVLNPLGVLDRKFKRLQENKKQI
ncbi:MAG: hypothetical protein LBS50_09885 [Prevotellaceae bacterium]|jgi:hypothetical protein|nr:hypothetical protein [Prevotellaceae bacterium]